MALDLSRDQILGYRRTVSALDERLPYSAASLGQVAAAGLQDSMPRAALLSIHARVAGTSPDAWEKPPLVQVWGPRYSAFVIAEDDLAIFTLGRLPDTPKARRRAEDTANRLETALGSERVDVRHAARTVGVHPNALRYAAPTGRFLIYWDGARQPLIWAVPAPAVDPSDARLELARRYVHRFGPTTPEAFAAWAGIRPKPSVESFEALGDELVAVATPLGRRWILAADEPSFRGADAGASTRLLPSGDTYYLLHGDERILLVPDETRRSQLWTSRVWPGAVLHDGEIIGTWRRSQNTVTIEAWQTPNHAVRTAIEDEATTLPLPGSEDSINVNWV